MKFIENISEKEYLDFFNKNPNAHFLQSYPWGISCKLSRNQIPYYIGLKNENNHLVAAALLLKKATPLKMCYFYAPRGFILDFNNTKILKEFTEKLKQFLTKENAIYLRVNPGIKYQDIDEEGQKIDGGINNYKIYNQMLKLGYQHQGFNKLYEGNAHRYTFRIDLHDELAAIEARMSKTFMKTIKRSYDYDLVIRESNDIKAFHNLIQNNAHKNDFHEYTLDFYQNFYNTFKKYKQAKIFEAVLNPGKVLKKFKDELKSKDLNSANPDIKNQVNRLENDIAWLKEIKDKEVVVCSLICVYTNYAAWTLYIGNDYTGTKTSAINRLYYESIKDAKNMNLNFMDLFGTVGDPHTKYKNLGGLYEFKRKMGGEYIEFIGEFDLVNKNFIYKALPFILKIYRQLKK